MRRMAVGWLLAGLALPLPLAAQNGASSPTTSTQVVPVAPFIPTDRERQWQTPQQRKQADAIAGGFVAGALLTTAVALTAGKNLTPHSDSGAIDVSRPVRAAEAPSPYRAETDDEAAVHACAKAAEGEGRRSYALAQVGQVRSAHPLGNGYDVQGDVLLRTSYREAGESRAFRCRVDAQAVRMIAIDGIQTLPTR
ncbi:hypothetical protein [Sphingomonas sp. 1185]|uniref:hypothetical protein n=1 Tax=Sphingomonas sp. 1185 TaxID=3156411 RepID=UPI00339729A9